MLEPTSVWPHVFRSVESIMVPDEEIALEALIAANVPCDIVPHIIIIASSAMSVLLVLFGPGTSKIHRIESYDIGSDIKVFTQQNVSAYQLNANTVNSKNFQIPKTETQKNFVTSPSLAWNTSLPTISFSTPNCSDTFS